MNVAERDWRETPCLRCGIDARWSFVDAGKTTVEVVCPDCGRMEMPREDFDNVAVENLEHTDREQAA
jgi:predicted RNA-binding Zn-ribbon protein involved in translation (DUF1610 family)